MRITADTDMCVGAGMCALTVPQVFDQDPEEGTVLLRTSESPAEQVERVQQAVRLCPSGAISLA